VETEPVHHVAPWEWGALAALAAAALLLRLYALDRIPAVVFHDECDNLVNVYQILHGRGPGFFGIDWKPQPAASVYIVSLAVRAGMSVFSLRAVTALFSVAALVPYYLLVRRAVSAPAALLASWLLATDIWYLHFSRAGWDNVFVCVPATAAALSIGAAVATGRIRHFAWAGVWSAIGAYGYPAGRLILPAVVLSAVVGFATPRGERRRIAAGIAVTVVVALALCIPQLPTALRDWDRYQSRARLVSALAGDNQQKSAGEQVDIVLGNFTDKLMQLFTDWIPKPKDEFPERYLRAEDGAFTRLTVVLLICGMLLSVTSRTWLAATWLWWVFLLVLFFGTQALTAGSSLNGARGVIFVPILYLFVGLALQQIWAVGRRWGRLGAGLLIAVVLGLSAWTTLQYFWWVQSPETLDALQPAIPVEEFPAWQARAYEWTRDSDGFYNLTMWEADKHERTENGRWPASN